MGLQYPISAGSVFRRQNLKDVRIWRLKSIPALFRASRYKTLTQVFSRWVTVVDDGPALKQHCVDIPCSCPIGLLHIANLDWPNWPVSKSEEGHNVDVAFLYIKAISWQKKTLNRDYALLSFKTHHYIIFVQPQHSKPGMESHCWPSADQLSCQAYGAIISQVNVFFNIVSS